MTDISLEKKKWHACFIGCIFLLGFMIGMGSAYGMIQYRRLADKDSEVRADELQYQYINPLLECSLSDKFDFNEVKPSKLKLERIIEMYKKEGFADHISIYFRNLNEGPWVGINEKEKFAPASLLKVPVMMTLLRAKEKDAKFFQQEYALDTSYEDDVIPYFTDGIILDKDKSYSIERLLQAMIIHSDNDALSTLSKHVVSIDQIYQLFGDLHIELPPDDQEDFISVKDYSVLFRVLYNASYLSRDSSEYALKLLSESTFQKGLVAGLPFGVKVAHKFGERDLNGVKQVHDCGIIYVTKHPYLLCVMTRGENFEKLATVIASLSKEVYNEMILSP
jgi:beta-lactamase class A